ncbi:hypothetical protein FB45DRAFT_755992 [Roridomyces roridus]|uniref:Acetyl-CoA synthetase-like protein n=1 Tax=Roridomyces roridus TaxID=1738132 RepID=A0AAD7FHB6_9AGAR|nr:hypothetical protein FB45DRAFT_755992 [Roridomyces roridus]
MSKHRELSLAAFNRPPSDNSLLFPEILAYHAKENPNYPLFCYLDQPLNIIKTISWAAAFKAFRRVSNILQEVKVANPAVRPTVAILAATDQITYFCLIAGIMSVGYKAFPISPRNSELAVQHLLKASDCTHILTTNDESTQKLTRAAAIGLASEGGTLTLIPAPTFEALFEPPVVGDDPLPGVCKPREDDLAIMLHSSGSTSLPKVIKITQLSLMHWALTPQYGEMDLCGLVCADGLPSFHLAGLFPVFWATMFGMVVSVLPPISPPVLPTPERVLNDAVATKCNILYCVPSFLEAIDPTTPLTMSISDSGNFKMIAFAGGTLQPGIGDVLTQNGIQLAHAYGMTEVGCISMFLPNEAPEDDWNYFHLSPHLDPVFMPIEGQPGVCRLVVKKCKTHLPAVLNTTIDGIPAFDTNDLLVRHPMNARLWKIYGHDQIMHSNGEKTNPAPLETIMLEDPSIKHAIIFGRGRFHAGEPCTPIPCHRTNFVGVVVFPTHSNPMDSDAANAHAPSHSRIFKEMILVGHPSKPVPLTAKGTPLRDATLQLYQDEINGIYIATEKSAQPHLNPPKEFDFSSCIEFVKLVVGGVMAITPGDDEDLFQRGCDSLQATWIRNSLLHGLKASTAANVRDIPQNFVYSHPTVRQLAQYMTVVASNDSPLSPSYKPCGASKMMDMVIKYTQNLPERQVSMGRPDHEVVVVTGTTGALGSHLLAQLLSMDEISAVYAFNRPGKNLEQRQHDAFTTYGLDARLLQSNKLWLLGANLTEPTTLGLPENIYSRVKECVTCIIHNAWHVDFKMSLSSLEPCVAGTSNLVNFSLSSPHTVPPRIIFVSSFDLLNRNFTDWTGGSVAPEQSIQEPNVSLGSGYAESKWVAEHILETAASCRADFDPVIVRVGQLCGADNGAWKPSEWFPTLLKLSQKLACLPDVRGQISWLPVHTASRILVKMRQSHHQHLHLTNPHPRPFSTIIHSAGEILQIPIVPYPQWLASLEGLALSQEVPLLGFFRDNATGSMDMEAFLGVWVSNEKGMEITNSRVEVEAPGASDVQRWVNYLKHVGYLCA